ncbi:MAG TPA: hypothetical protein VF446_12175 [Trinickia sp.]
MRQIQWLDAARHWIGSTLHWDAMKGAMHDAIEREHGPHPWVIAYETEHGFCCLHAGEALEFAGIEDVRAWAEDAGVQIYFIGL